MLNLEPRNKEHSEPSLEVYSAEEWGGAADGTLAVIGVVVPCDGFYYELTKDQAVALVNNLQSIITALGD